MLSILHSYDLSIYNLVIHPKSQSSPYHPWYINAIDPQAIPRIKHVMKQVYYRSWMLSKYKVKGQPSLAIGKWITYGCHCLNVTWRCGIGSNKRGLPIKVMDNVMCMCSFQSASQIHLLLIITQFTMLSMMVHIRMRGYTKQWIELLRCGRLHVLSPLCDKCGRCDTLA